MSTPTAAVASADVDSSVADIGSSTDAAAIDHQLQQLLESVRLGHLPAHYHESDDPNRLVPIVWDAEDYMVLVTGDEMRNSAYILAHQGSLGYPVAREIRLPKHWQALRAEDEAKRRSLLAGG